MAGPQSGRPAGAAGGRAERRSAISQGRCRGGRRTDRQRRPADRDPGFGQRAAPAGGWAVCVHRPAVAGLRRRSGRGFAAQRRARRADLIAGRRGSRLSSSDTRWTPMMIEMPRSTRSLLATLLTAAAPVLAYFALLPVVQLGSEQPAAHVIAVGGTAALASFVAVLLTLAAVRRNDLRGGLVGAAFTAMAGLLTIHALATPGFLLEEYGRNATIGLAGVSAVPAAAALLALAVAVPASIERARQLIVGIEAAVLIALIGFGTGGLLHPQLIPLIPLSVEPWMYLVLIPTTAVYGLVALRAYRTSRLTRRRADGWLAIGVCWLGVSLALYLLSNTWSLGFWWAHMMEGLGVAVVTFCVAIDLARQRPSQAIGRDLRGEELVGSEQELLGGYVRALTSSLRDLDPSTGAHSRRVAAMSVRVGEHLGLGSDSVRRLAIAGLVHD